LVRFNGLKKQIVDNTVDNMWINVDKLEKIVDNFFPNLAKCGYVDKCQILSTGYPHGLDKVAYRFE